MGLEERKFRRKGGRVMVDIEDVESSKVFEALTVDISEGGLRLLLDESLPRGSIVMASCKFPQGVAGDFYLESKAVVRWTKPMDDQFELGIEFLELSPQDQMQLADYILRNSGGY